MENKSWTVTYRNRDNGQRITAAVFAVDQQQAREKAKADGREAWEVESIEPNEETLARILIAEFAKKQSGHFACPRCGKMTMDAESVTRNALSRRVGCYICDTCGTVEAIEDFAHKQDSLSTWAIVREPERWHRVSSFFRCTRSRQRWRYAAGPSHPPRKEHRGGKSSFRIK